MPFVKRANDFKIDISDAVVTKLPHEILYIVDGKQLTSLLFLKCLEAVALKCMYVNNLKKQIIAHTLKVLLHENSRPREVGFLDTRIEKESHESESGLTESMTHLPRRNRIFKVKSAEPNSRKDYEAMSLKYGLF